MNIPLRIVSIESIITMKFVKGGGWGWERGGGCNENEAKRFHDYSRLMRNESNTNSEFIRLGWPYY